MATRGDAAKMRKRSCAGKVTGHCATSKTVMKRLRNSLILLNVGVRGKSYK